MTTLNRSFESALRTNVLYADRQLSIQASGDGSISISGQIDLTNSDAIATALTNARADDGTIIVDVAGLQFIDLYGLRTLALLSKDPLGRPVRLRNVPPSLRRLLGLLSWPSFTIG